jgi:hypothetical protein
VREFFRDLNIIPAVLGSISFGLGDVREFSGSYPESDLRPRVVDNLHVWVRLLMVSVDLRPELQKTAYTWLTLIFHYSQ